MSDCKHPNLQRITVLGDVDERFMCSDCHEVITVKDPKREARNKAADQYIKTVMAWVVGIPVGLTALIMVIIILSSIGGD